MTMKHVGLKRWKIDSGSRGTRTVRKRDRQKEEDELWRKTSVMKWKKLSVGGNNVYAATLCVFLCVLLSPCLLVLRVCLFSRARLLSISLSFNSPPFFVCLSLSRSVSLPSNPLPPGLVEQWADMSLFLCKSNWRQAFIGMTWRWVAKSFQPSCLRLVPLSSRTVLYTDTAAAATDAGSALTMDPEKSNAPNAHCLNGFKSCDNP